VKNVTQTVTLIYNKIIIPLIGHILDKSLYRLLSGQLTLNFIKKISHLLSVLQKIRILGKIGGLYKYSKISPDETLKISTINN
jgi:hypothetical protein